MILLNIYQSLRIEILSRFWLVRRRWWRALVEQCVVRSAVLMMVMQC